MYFIILLLICILCYAVPQFLYLILGDNNIKEKYGKNQKEVWAVVTGASSGIGKSLTFKLAAKGINVVAVAKDDEAMSELQPTLRGKFPLQKFRFIATDLSNSSGDYLQDIIKHTDDLQVSLLFNNAGYLIMDNFATSSLDGKLANIECNVTSVVRITDHFYRKMIDKGAPAAIAFTASSLAFCPSPYAPIYSAGKAFLSAFAHSFAVEAKEHGVDVLVVHPGAVTTSFYQNSPNLLVFRILKFIGQTSDSVADVILKNLGRIYSFDSGIFAIIAKLQDKILGPNITIPLMRVVSRVLPDMKRFKTKSS